MMLGDTNGLTYGFDMSLITALTLSRSATEPGYDHAVARLSPVLLRVVWQAHGTGPSGVLYFMQYLVDENAFVPVSRI
jgi:hypothetical protein